MSRIRQAILPGYLLLCLVLGGSSQGMWGNALLQLGAIAILAWTAVTKDPQPIPRPGRMLLAIAGLVLLLLGAQLVPLPPAAWTKIPGREFLLDGFAMLGAQLPWRPVSLAPYDTMATALTLLPPLALLVGLLRLRGWSVGWMFAAIVIGAAISIILGTLQVTGGGDNAWYFYDRTNLGVAVGTFANGNHYATLLLVALPLLAALAAGRWRLATKSPQRAFTAAVTAAAASVLGIGFLINGSAAILLLGPPVAIGTLLLALRLSPRRVRQGLLVLGLLLVGAAAILVFAGRVLPDWGTQASIETRAQIWSQSMRAAEDRALAGSGIGTFEKVYRRYEDPGAVDSWYVNHAHNDYLEIAVEGGVAAVLLLVLFLIWWALRTRDAWLSPAGSVEQKAAAVASAAILLHSAFDYPLRTAGIAGVMAVCLAVLAGARGVIGGKSAEEEAQEPPRHATL